MCSKTLTDAEIKNALVCCINEDDNLFNCGDKNCAFMDCKMGKDRECHYYMLKSVLNLINSKDQENESLKAEVDKLKSELAMTRNYIHDNGLEWDLLSYSERKNKND